MSKYELVTNSLYFLLILGVLWRSLRLGHYSATKHTGIEMAEIYWHFVDIIWIILFTLLYILTLF